MGFYRKKIGREVIDTKQQAGKVITPARPVYIREYAGAVGKKETEGPLSALFDITATDNRFGEDTWEKAETALQIRAIETVLRKADIAADEIGCLFSGDLLNQNIASGYAARELGIPFFGLYSACSAMTEALCLGTALIGGGMMKNCLCAASSHFCSAERQFRFPLEYGSVRTPSAQWTVTGCGCVLLSDTPSDHYRIGITRILAGRVIDLGITDITDMGAAMAPAAADTLLRFFSDTASSPADYDCIFTGDLGREGSRLLNLIMEREGCPLGGRQQDCGILIYSEDQQDIRSGGSGCGCSASVFSSYIMREMREGRLSRILFLATGALMSTVSLQQGESIPAISHLTEISRL